MNDHVVHVSEFCQPSDRVVDSAVRVAAHIRQLAATTDRFVVSMSNVSGASSSFFNVLLSELVETFGATGWTDRVRFVDLDRAQRFVFERSLAAVSKA